MPEQNQSSDNNVENNYWLSQKFKWEIPKNQYLSPFLLPN